MEIVNPVLKAGHDANWFYPWDVPEEIAEDSKYLQAQEEGWAEWIQNELDWEAVKKGYKYDLSRDLNGNPAYWMDGAWQLHDGRVVEVEDEEEYIGYVGRGDHFQRFCETFLKFTKEPLAGKPYRFLPWMRLLCATLFGWVKDSPSRYRRYHNLYVAIAKKNGKALANETPIPTLNGWKDHGGLRVGDKLFDRHGQVCEVIQVHPKENIDREVVFSNGETIRCSKEHLWVTETLRKPGGAEVPNKKGSYYSLSPKETQDISRTLDFGDAKNHRIPMQPGLQLPEDELPIDPWLLGAWVGDGASASGRITCGKTDEPYMRYEIEKLGYKVGPYKHRTFTVYGLKTQLRQLGVLGNKHIPQQYLRASKTQRLALLQGLMDTDGTISKRATDISFSQKSSIVARNVAELLASLGLKYTLTEKNRTCTNSPNGEKVCKANHIQFGAFKDLHPVFRMPRKLERMRSTNDLQKSIGRSRNVHIVDVREIEPVEGNCITVSSEDGTYLCGKSMLPTHNSALMSVIAIYMLLADDTPKAQVYSCACDRNQARIIYDEAAHMVRGSVLEDHVRIVDSRARLVHESSGSFYCVLSSDAHRNDGIDSSCTLVDEIHQHPNRKLYSIMLRAGLARPEPLMAVITTYGPSLSDGSIWAEVHNEAKAQLAGNRPDTWRNLVFVASAEEITVTTTAPVPAGSTRIPVSRLEQPVGASEVEFDLSAFSDDLTASGDDEEAKVVVKIAKPARRFQNYLEVEPLEQDIPAFSEATANKDWDSDHAIRRANPSVGVVFPLDRVRETIQQSRSPEKEAETKQLNLNIVAGSGRKWISGAAWSACNRHQVQPKHLIGRQCYGGLDLSFANDLTAFGLAFPKWDVFRDNFDELQPQDCRVDLLTWAWVPEASIEERSEMEKFPYRHYANQSYLIDGKGPVRICPGRVINFSQVAEEIIEITRHFEMLGIAYDPNFASFVVPSLVEEGLTCIIHRQGAMAMSPPCKRFSEGVYKGWMVHGDNPLLNRAVEGAQLHPPDKNGNTYLSRGNSVTRIDPLVAQVMAVGFCCDPPEEVSDAYSSPAKGMWG